MGDDGRPFLLDSSVFLEAAKRRYAPDLASPFWRELGRRAQEGRALSIDRVRDEMDPKNQELKEWADAAFQRFESTNQDDVISAYAGVMRWAKEERDYTDAAKAQFAMAKNSGAWAVAYALARKPVVVTEERLKNDAGRTVPVPNACAALGVRCIDTPRMLRELQIRLEPED